MALAFTTPLAKATEGRPLTAYEEVIRVFDELTETPMLQCRRHPRKNIRWRCPNRFPYRVVYEVVEAQNTIVVAAVLHAARHDRHWQRRV